jgi:hypothetical protein
MSASTLFAALQSIPDHRTRKERRFPLAAILAISIAAMLSGANDLIAIFRWGRRLSPKALQAPAPALADIRSAFLTLIRSSGQKPRPAREAFAARKWAAIRLVMTS